MSLRAKNPVTFSGLRQLGESTPIYFELLCFCGAPIRGLRQTKPQTLPCPGCGQMRFILPLSVFENPGNETELPAERRRRGKWWLVACVVGLSLVVASSLGARFLFHAPDSGTRPRRLSDEQRFEQHRSDGQTALEERSFRRAARELQAAVDLARGLPEAEKRSLIQQQRQAAILADLLSESLAEIVRQSAGVPETEWREIFRERYAGRSFIIDDILHRDAAGQYHQQFKIRLNNAEAKLGLGRVKLLKYLPLNDPKRVVIAFRLEIIRKEKNGWTIDLDPEGGVLLTDPGLLTGLSVAVDADLRQVLTNQRLWQAESVPP